MSVISAVIENESVPHHACNLFASIGAHLLRQHYRLQARAVSGAAFFKLTSNHDVLAFAENDNGRIFASLRGFHSWIECKDYMIDFLAPLFPENVAERDLNVHIGKHVFMKPLSQMLTGLPKEGDPKGAFFLIPDQTCQTNMEETMSKPLAVDLHNISAEWFCKPPKKIDSELSIRDNRGKVITKKRKDTGIQGFW